MKGILIGLALSSTIWAAIASSVVVVANANSSDQPQIAAASDRQSGS